MAISVDQLVLTEDDIPGAKLKGPLESHTMSELRWWLLCHGIVAPTSFKKDKLIARVCEATKNDVPVIDVDGSYLYRKQRLLDTHASFIGLPLPDPPLSGWETVTSQNLQQKSTVVPLVTPGMLYTYLADGCGRNSSQGAFRALQRGFIHWASGRLDCLEINHRHPDYCHVRCIMVPSMRPGAYHVYILLGKNGEVATVEKATCECAAGESSSCTHVSGLLHALVAMCPSQLPGSAITYADDQALPITSFACKWKPPRKRKETTLQFAEAEFHKPVYGRQVKHTLSSIADFDPRPLENRGTAPKLLAEYLKKVKGDGLGVSVLNDPDMQVWKDDPHLINPSYSLPSKDEIVEKVRAFKQCLEVTLDQIREIDQTTTEQSSSPTWFSARRYRLTASVFGRILKRKPTTPPDALVKELLNSKVFTNRAIEWGKINEPVAIKKYHEKQGTSGDSGIILAKAGFVISKQFPFLGASPDGYVYDPSSLNQYGLVEVKCPYKFRFHTIESAAAYPEFCLTQTKNPDGTLTIQLKLTHDYYSQVQGQLAITERKWCDFVVYTTKDVFIQRIEYNEDFWLHKLLPKLIDFYDNCFAPAIVSPVHILGMKLHDLRMNS